MLSDGEPAFGNTETPLTVEASESTLDDENGDNIYGNLPSQCKASPTVAPCDPVSVEPPKPAFYEILKEFPEAQFYFKGESRILPCLGGLDLFSGCGGVAAARA